MTTTEVRFQVSPEIVTGVRDEVVAKPLGEFRAEEVAHMQPGMEAFDLGIYGDTCQLKGPETANAMRAGLLVAHRILRRTINNEVLPHDIDMRLSAMTGKVAIEPLFEYKHLEINRRAVETAYEGPAIPMLFSDILRQDGSRSGAILLLGMYLPYANPAMRTRITLAPGPATASSSRHGAHVRHRANHR